MKTQIYVAPVIEKIAVEIENGIAASGASPAPANYGTAGAAGNNVDETGNTNW